MKKVFEFKKNDTPYKIGQRIFAWLKMHELIYLLKDNDKLLTEDVTVLIEIIES